MISLPVSCRFFRIFGANSRYLPCVIANRCLSSPTLRRSPEARAVRQKNLHNLQSRAVERNRSPLSEAATKEIIALGKQGKWHDVASTFNAASEKDTILFNVTMTAADRCGRYDEGLLIFSEMKAAGVTLTGVSYAAVLTLLGRKGMQLQARALWDEMRSADVQPTTACLTGMLNAAAANGDISAVEAGLAEAEAAGSPPLSLPAVNSLVRAAREARDTGRALSFVRDIRARGLKPQVVSYCLAMGACSRAVDAGKMDESAAAEYIQTLKAEMAADGVAPDAYFLEEELSALLGWWPLDTSNSAGRVPSDAAVEAARAAIDAATRTGIRKTVLINTLEEFLRSRGRSTPYLVSQLPKGWHETVDPASGQSYYWKEDDPAATTTWQRPS